jgi:hypothetical protein
VRVGVVFLGGAFSVRDKSALHVVGTPKSMRLLDIVELHELLFDDIDQQMGSFVENTRLNLQAFKIAIQNTDNKVSWPKMKKNMKTTNKQINQSINETIDQ